jgi:hypothetical protein
MGVITSGVQGVRDGVTVGVQPTGVTVGVVVSVGVAVLVLVAVAVGVAVCVGVGVADEVGEGV